MTRAGLNYRTGGRATKILVLCWRLRFLFQLTSSWNPQPRPTSWRVNNQQSALGMHGLRKEGFECQRLFHPFDKELYDFYGKNFSPKQNKRLVPSLPNQDKDDDAVYVLRTQQRSVPQNEIVAALRLTRSKASNNDDYTFLRSLCVSQAYRRHGLSLRLLQDSLQSFDTNFCYCFAASDLQEFYQKAGFSIIPTSNITDYTNTPKWLVHSFQTMANRWKQQGRSLDLFIRYPHPKEAIHVVLLQHFQELSKDTATGWLVDDDLYQESINMTTTEGVSLSSRLVLHRWIWNGRNDTASIEEKINQLGSTSKVFLLWTTGSSDDKDLGRKMDSFTGLTYIVLDGTWQQAKSMFRRIPTLWNLPRVALSGTNIPPSIYTLRKDFSGWRNRFSSTRDEGDDLLCTAEVVAAVLERNGDSSGANEIRTRLNIFQENYQRIVHERRERANENNEMLKSKKNSFNFKDLHS